MGGSEISKLVNAELWCLVHNVKFYTILAVSFWIYLFIALCVMNPESLNISGENIDLAGYLGIMLKITDTLYLGVGLSIYYASTINKQIDNGQIWYYKSTPLKKVFYAKTITVFILFFFYMVLNILNLIVAYMFFFSTRYSNVFNGKINITRWDVHFCVLIVTQQVIQLLIGYVIAIKCGAIYGILMAFVYQLISNLSKDIHLISWLYPTNYIDPNTNIDLSFYACTYPTMFLVIFFLLALAYSVFQNKITN